MTAPKPSFKEYDATVVDVQEPKEDSRVIRFELDGMIDFVCGQFVQVFIPGLKKPSSFSIANSPADDGHVELAFHKVGPVTSALCNLKKGDHCTLRGPLGRFTFSAEDGDVVALAGGVGITPFMSAMRFIRDRRLPNKYTLFYSAKEQAGLIYYDEIKEVSDSLENVDAVFTITRELPDEWAGETRRCDAAMITTHVPDYKERTYYLCGPKPFLDAMLGILHELEIPEEKIRRELW